MVLLTYTAVQVLPVRPDDDICDMAFGGNLAYLVRNVNNNFKAASAAKNIGREILYVDVLAPCESYVLLLNDCDGARNALTCESGVLVSHHRDGCG